MLLVMHDAELATIHAFILPARRTRVEALASKPDRAARLQGVLAHQRILDSRFMRQVPPNETSAEEIESVLRAKGAPGACRVMGGDLDSQELPLAEALAQIEGCLVVCIPGHLAYFEGEEKNDRHILER